VPSTACAASEGRALRHHDIQEGTWPEAVLFSALCFGGLSIFILVVAAVERAFNRTR
jgi:hypothetical protein